MKSLKTFIAGLFLIGCTNSSSNYQTINAQSAKDMMENQDVEIIDVREESEYQAGHIPVSYTHLDVYKRQASYHCDCHCIENKGSVYFFIYWYFCWGFIIK